jgi:acyl dehydratase
VSTATETLDWSAPFEALAPGLAFTTPERVVRQADIDAFAVLTGDHHRQHVDHAWAARSQFGGTIAHGLLVLSAAAGLVPFDPERVVALRAVRDVVFKRPVRPGDAIRVEGSVESVREPGLVTCRWRVIGADDKLCAQARVEVVWR